MVNKDGRYVNGNFWARDQCSGPIGTNYTFIESTRGGAKADRKRHDLAEEKLQKAKGQWNEDKMKRLDFINKTLRQNNKATAYINNTKKVILKTLLIGPQLSD